MAEKPKEVVDMAPDPDEDDLDDLDDVLDQFNAQPKTSSKSTTSQPAQPAASGPGRPKDEHHDLPSDADLEAQLQAGMKNLMGELDGNPEMQKEFEKMMAELVAAGQAGSDAEAMEHIGHATEAINHPPGPDTAEAKAAGSKKSAQPESFQDTIRKTMERMQGSSDSASAAAASNPSNSEEALLAQMMAQLQGGGGGEGGEEDFSKMLMSMMTQLTNKDILYEPMKELHDKFPPWLEKHKGEVEKEDWERYLEQQKLVDEIVGRFERKEYSDDNEDDREFIVERMQKMQAAGSPPPALVGDMSAAQEALGELDAGCPTQ